MMFSLHFAILVLFTLSVTAQQTDKSDPSNNVEKGYSFGRLRLADDGKKEELMSGYTDEKSQVKQKDQSQNVQPLPSPCIGARASTKLAYPGDKTKYISCRDEFHYEIFSCPMNGAFNEQRAACDETYTVIDRCALETPCLNGGQCSVLSNSTFKCTCRPDWTGERCEAPINSCVNKPCGPNAECRILPTKDYEQDYVCVCHAKRGYGLSCQDVVPNPCLRSTEQYFPFAYSQHAYIQCDADLIYFQPCGPILNWNQEEKICDRKKPPKLSLKALLKTYGSDIDELTTTTTPTTTTTISTTTTTTTEKPLQEQQIESSTPFVPVRVANRPYGLFGQNQRPVQGEQNQYSQPSGSNQWSNQPSSVQPEQSQKFGSQQWLNQVPTANTQSQSWQNRPVNQWNGNQQQSDLETTTTTTTTPSTVSQQSWQTQPSNQWNSNQVPQSQSWQNFRVVTTTTPSTMNFQSWQKQQADLETTTTTTPSTVIQQSWQNQPNNQWNSNQVPQSQSWQNFRVVTTQQPVVSTTTTPSTLNLQSWEKQQSDLETTTTTTTPSTVIQQSWQNQPNNQWSANPVPQTQSWQNYRVVTQQPVLLTTTTPSTMNFQSWQKQQADLETTTTTTTPSTVNQQSWQTQPSSQWNTNQVPQSQSWQNFRVVTTTTPSTMNFQSWQKQQADLETTTTTTPSTVIQQSWQNQPNNQWNSNQVPQSQSWQNFRVATPQQPIFPTTTTTSQTVVPSLNTQSWQKKPMNQWNSNQDGQTQLNQPLQDQTESQFQSATPTVETTTPLNSVLSENSWQQTKPVTRWNTNSVSQTVGFQPQSRPNYQGVSTQQPILPLTTTTTPSTIVLPVVSIQKSFDQSSASNNLNYQKYFSTPSKDQRKSFDSGSWSYSS